VFNVKVREPRIEEINQLYKFFNTVITDTFIKEGIDEKLNDIKEEIEMKEKYLDSYFKSIGEKRYFLVASYDDLIIGSIEYGPVSELINKCTKYAYKDLVEVGTVFVHPDYQRNGVGNLLLKAMYITLLKKGIKEFCLDSGYSRAQKIWQKKFGEPDYLLKDYWDKENDHMIWRVQVSDSLIE
jgi:GNAT superfamily N-acetyltransferase